MPKKTKGTTQKEKILDHLKSNESITPIEALNQFQCFRLADIIFKLRKDGYNITKTIPKGRVHAEYKMVM